MNDDLHIQYKQTKDILEQHYLPIVRALLDKQIEFLASCKVRFSRLKKLGAKADLEEEYKLIKDYKTSLIPLIRENFEKPVNVKFDDIFFEFHQALSNHIATVDEIKVLVQKDERFIPQPTDSNSVKGIKILKSFLLKTAKSPKKIANWFRRLLKKPTIPITNWKHRIQFRNLTHYYLKEQLSGELLILLDDVFENICITSKSMWQIDESLDHAMDNFVTNGSSVEYVKIVSDKVENSIDLLNTLKAKLANKALYILDDVFDQYQFNLTLTGTIELSNSRFSDSKIARKHARLNIRCISSFTNWYNTLMLLKEDWDIDLELYLIIYAAREKYHQILKSLNQSVTAYSRDEFSAIREYFKASRKELEKCGDDELKRILEEELKSLPSSKYMGLLERVNESILDKDFPKLIDLLEAEVNDKVHHVSEKRAIVKGVDYEKPIKTSLISYVSTKELIDFESLSLFEKVTKNVKIQISNNINEAQLKISELHQIAQFNLESALTLFNEASARVENPRDIALDGLDRTLDKLEKINVHFEGFDKLFKEDLTAGLDQFAASLIKLTSNENIYDIRMRIAKGKAIKRSIQIKENILNNFRNIFPKIIRYLQLKYANVKSWIRATFKKYGLVDTKEGISTELADFLAETSHAVEKLPFVYRRLFKSTPLTDKALFQGRKEEIRVLNNAYNNWMKGRFAASIIIGEKGSGVTSLINIYLNDLSNSCEMIRFSPQKGIHSPDELVTLMSQELGIKFDGMNALVSFLIKGEKKVVVIENIQLLFLKKVNGFTCLHQLMELISLTYKHIFWVMSCTAYSWDYLNKTMSIGEHFSYVIKMKDFDNTTVIDIITRRHKISGYDIRFEPSSEDLNDKKFKKLKEVDQQNLLRNEFFNDLNKIAKSNVSLGLIYWMRSTKEISGNILLISSLKDIDFSFMKSLSINKAYSLMELLLHDGLSEKEFCDITNQAVSRSRSVLNPLREDGIVIFDNEVYRINPLLYRQTINLLKIKNIIH